MRSTPSHLLGPSWKCATGAPGCTQKARSSSVKVVSYSTDIAQISMARTTSVEPSDTDRGWTVWTARAASWWARNSAKCSSVALNFAGTALFAATTWFAASSLSNNPTSQANLMFQSYFDISFSSTVTILRILQGWTSFLGTLKVSQACEWIQWTLASHEKGIQLLSNLGLLPSTGLLGVLALAVGKRGTGAFVCLYPMYPQPNLTSPTESVIIVRKAPGTQLEFTKGVSQSDAFRPEDCQVYGDTNATIGVALCMAPSRSSPGSVIAGKKEMEPFAW